jgi:hypothetical protein
MTHGIFYLKTGPRPTSVTKVRHGTQLLAHASNLFGCIQTSANIFLNIRTIKLGAKRRETQIRNKTPRR